MRSLKTLATGAFMAVFGLTLAGAVGAEPLRFAVRSGDEQSWLLQEPRGAFHVALTERPCVRLVVASPAGNTGCALWLAGDRSPRMTAEPSLRGREEVAFSLALAAPTEVRATVAGSVRTVRDYVYTGRRALPELDGALARLGPDHSLVRRMRSWRDATWTVDGHGTHAALTVKGLDGVHEYQVELQAPGGGLALVGPPTPETPSGRLRLPKGELRVTYRSNHEPLTPFAPGSLFSPAALASLDRLPAAERAMADELVNGLRFLAYDEKFLAGSWRYLTYFGRDTLISLRLLAPALSVEALESGLRSVAARMSPEGEVTHEEDLADQAALDRLRTWLASPEGTAPPEALGEPVYDRKMVDDDFLVLPLLLDYWHRGGRRLFEADGASFDALARNLDRVLGLARRLRPLTIEAGQAVGDWRDSETGLGGGTAPFSVNGAHVPAALAALDRLTSCGAWARGSLRLAAARLGLRHLGVILERPALLGALRARWEDMWRRFLVTPTEDQTAERLAAHRRFLGLPPGKGGDPYPAGFLGLSLGADGAVVPVLHSDTALALLDLPLTDPLAFDLMLRPFETAFPDGLASPAGMLTASAALAPDDATRRTFDRNQYHGEVVWGWPQVLLQVALQRRLGDWTTPAPGSDDGSRRRRLQELRTRLTALLRELSAWRGAELWTWRVGDGGGVEPARYGADAASVTEANAVQLWSVAALGVELLGP